MYWKLLFVILCLSFSGSFGQHNWDSDEMGDMGKAGNDVLVPRTFDDAIKMDKSKEPDDDSYKEGDGMYPREGKYPNCTEHKYYGDICMVQGYQSHKCPRTPCFYATKEATTATIGGTRITIELAKTFRKVGSECEERKDCSTDCKCATIWCKVPEIKKTKINGKYYKDMHVFIPYPCGCQCRGTSKDGTYSGGK